MLKTYVKIALRTLWKNRVSSTINIAGLATGLSACLIIALYIQLQLSFDSFQPNGNRIGRVIMRYSFDGSPESKEGNFTSTKVAPVFSRTFPEVVAGVRMSEVDMLIQLHDVLIKEPHFMYTDSSFFDAFYFKIVEGTSRKALDGPNKVVLSKSTARKYFGDKSAVGQLLLTGADKTPYEVTAVVEDYPANSQFRFDFLASFSSQGVNQEQTYFDANYTTYLLLRDENQFASLQSKIDPFMKNEMAGSGATISFHIEPFNEIHLNSPHDAFVPNVNLNYLYILGAIASLILLIVCFTYINLSTARSVERAREIGIRKVVGAARTQVFWQFMGESFVLCLGAALLCILMTMLALPGFNRLTEENVSAGVLFHPAGLLLSFGGIVLVSLLAGAYPSLVLSRFQPASVLKGVFKNTDAGKWIQKTLIVFQFGIAVFLIAATIIIQSQLNFIQNKRLGFDRSHILVLPVPVNLRDHLESIKEQFRTNPDLIGISYTNSAPVHIRGGYNMRAATMPENETVSVFGNAIDNEYLTTTGLELVAGKNLTEQDMKDVAFENWRDRTYHFILNERAVKELGWTPEEAIVKKMFMGDNRPGLVRGVVKDFHFESLHNAINPLSMFSQHEGRRLLLKIKGDHLEQTIASVEKQWKQLAPEMPFDYTFMDDDYNQLYKSEMQLGKVMNLFAGIAIALACVGLFGLSIDVVQQRIKEIGIRKILGASGLQIVSLISGKFTKLVLISIVIATPVAWFVLGKWLQGFAYRIDVMWWMFVLAGGLAMTIALVTVSFEAIKAVMMNPAQSLKAE